MPRGMRKWGGTLTSLTSQSQLSFSKFLYILGWGQDGNGCGYKRATRGILVMLEVLCIDCSSVAILVGGNWAKGAQDLFVLFMFFTAARESTIISKVKVWIKNGYISFASLGSLSKIHLNEIEMCTKITDPKYLTGERLNYGKCMCLNTIESARIVFQNVHYFLIFFKCRYMTCRPFCMHILLYSRLKTFKNFQSA